jgi:hypothetical protein
MGNADSYFEISLYDISPGTKLFVRARVYQHEI